MSARHAGAQLPAWAGERAAAVAALSFAAAWLAYAIAANAVGARYAGSRGSLLAPMWACAFGALVIANAAAVHRAALAAASAAAADEAVDAESGVAYIEDAAGLTRLPRARGALPRWVYSAAGWALAAPAFLFSAFIGAAVSREAHAAVWSAASCVAAVASVAAALPPLRAVRATPVAPRPPRPRGCNRACCASACSCCYIWTTVILSAVVLVGFGVQAPLAASELARFPPPGRRYLVPLQPGGNGTSGTLRMHIVCAGQRRSASAPLLVMEHGGGSASVSFAELQVETAALGFRSCAYDRSGVGYSDSPPLGRTSVAATRDRLAALLAAAGEVPPYVIWVRSNAHRLWRQHVITWREVAEDTTRVIT